MEHIEDTLGMLDLIPQGAFCVKDGTIIRVNEPARRRGIPQGVAVDTVLGTGKQEYSEFTGGCLYLTVQAGDARFSASVTRRVHFDVFVLEQDDDQAELQAMALAAQELRNPLTGVMTVADQLFPLVSEETDPALQENMARINRGLFQMLRIVSNMSDAYRYCQELPSQLQTRNICAVVEELFLSAAPMISHTGMTLHFEGPQEAIFCLADVEKLERAIHNILSNAVKFAPKGSTIDASLTRRGDMLYLTVQDAGNGIREDLRAGIYGRFRREPGLEDSRFGIGLGMVLIRSAATAHGGTVLMDQTETNGNRVTMTIPIRKSTGAMVRSPILHVDYAGEMDHRLLELSDSLPAHLYRKEKNS